MPIVELFSKRKKKLEGKGEMDIYRYDILPAPLRGQIIHIMRDAAGCFDGFSYRMGDKHFSNSFWTSIVKVITREKGLLGLQGEDPEDQCCKYLLSSKVDDALDLVEVAFKLLDSNARSLTEAERRYCQIQNAPDDAIAELNYRFGDHGIGYAFEGNKIIPVGSSHLHVETVKPAISLLNEAGFKGPLEEFLRAHEKHRKGDSKGAISEANNAFESTMKAICDVRGWSYPEGAQARHLIETIFEKGLIPPHLSSHFNALRSVMESGLPTVRNKQSGHGQGIDPVEVPPHIAEYALHLCASNIVFLIKAHKTMK